MKKLWNILRIILSIFLLLFLIYNIGLENLFNALIEIPSIIVILFSINYLVSIVLGAINIKILSDTIKKILFKDMIKYYFISWSIGLISPGKVGEFSILYFLKRYENIGYGKTLAISVIDKLMTIISLVIVSSLIIPMVFQDTGLLMAILFIISFIFILICMLNSDFIRTLIKKYILRKHAVKFEKFHSTFRSIIKKHKSKIFLNFLLTLLKWFSTASFTYIALIVMGQNISLFTVFVIVCITILVSIIPISLSGLGVKEMTFIGLMALYGVSSEIILALSILSLAIAYVLAAVSSIAIRIKKQEK
jgi:hypothetical protein